MVYAELVTILLFKVLNYHNVNALLVLYFNYELYLSVNLSLKRIH